MARIALKIDADTWRGTRLGVPALAELLQREEAGATFLFSLGPDHTGWAITRALRPGFLSKVSRTSVVEHYGVRTLLYGTVLPGPDIGRREGAGMRAVRDAGFEVGVHAWDHVRWHDRVAAESAAWTGAEMRRASVRFAEIFGDAPRVHGAAGWQMNEAAYRLEAELGFAFASDTRGSCPYLPVDGGGTVLGPPQLPTTLPTLDELIGLDGCTPGNAHERLLGLTGETGPDQVFTLHAELEGMKLLPVFERLLRGWRAQHHTLISLGRMFAELDCTALPRCRAMAGAVPGRSGSLAVQGHEVAKAQATGLDAATDTRRNR